LRLFDITADTPSLFAPGDRVRFQAIDEDQFRDLAATA
jgi:allophanate hydrolase subunit 1